MELTLAQLAKRGGVSARTVRYYIQRGLLPAPAFRGPDTCYAETHLLGLQAIRVLQAAYWPLDAIAATLQGRSNEQLRAIAAGALPEARGMDCAVPSGPVPQPYAAARPARVSLDQVAAPSSIDSFADQRPAPLRVHGSRVALAPGLELWLADSASESARELAEEIERWVDAQKSGVTHD